MLPYQCACSSVQVSEGASPKLETALFSVSTKPSPVFFAAIEGVSSNIGSQIAVKMAMDAVVGEAPRTYDERESADTAEGQGIALEIVRNVFREANSRVYEYAHRMGAGGQVSAKGIVAVFDGERVTIGQAGDYESYLWRAGKVVQFYERQSAASPSRGGVLERFIGANAKILVDLATVTVRQGDIVVITTLSPTTGLRAFLEETLRNPVLVSQACRKVAKHCAQLLLAGHENSYSFKHGVAFMLLVGEPEIALREVVFEEFEKNPI